MSGQDDLFSTGELSVVKPAGDLKRNLRVILIRGSLAPHRSKRGSGSREAAWQSVSRIAGWPGENYVEACRLGLLDLRVLTLECSFGRRPVGQESKRASLLRDKKGR